MAPAYRVDGAADSQHDGTYYRMATAQCNGKPVYQRGGSDGGPVLFQPEGGLGGALDRRPFRIFDETVCYQV